MVWYTDLTLGCDVTQWLENAGFSVCKLRSHSSCQASSLMPFTVCHLTIMIVTGQCPAITFHCLVRSVELQQAAGKFAEAHESPRKAESPRM